MSKVYALEPNRGMIRLAERERRQTKLDIEFIEQMKRAYLARFPKSWTHSWWGTATPQSR